MWAVLRTWSGAQVDPMKELGRRREGVGAPGSGPSDSLGAGEASAAEVEGVASAGEPTWAGDLGQRAAEDSRELGGGVCM